MRRSERAFTLLEVLGAIALLGIVYVTLSRAAIEGLRAEGDSRRRLEASLLADEKLAEFEQTIAGGGTPPLGRGEKAEGEFTVLTDVRAFEPPPPPSPAEAARRGARSERPDPFHPEKGTLSFFGPPPSGMTPALKSVDVVVRWGTGDDQREVRRSTWALDPSGAQALATLASQAASERAAHDLATKRDSRRERNQRKEEKPDATQSPPFGNLELPDPADLPREPEEDVP